MFYLLRVWRMSKIAPGSYHPIILYKPQNKCLSLYYYPNFTVRKLSLWSSKFMSLSEKFGWKAMKALMLILAHSFILSAHIIWALLLVSTLELDNRMVPFFLSLACQSVTESPLWGKMTWRLLKRKVTFELWFRNTAEQKTGWGTDESQVAFKALSDNMF